MSGLLRRGTDPDELPREDPMTTAPPIELDGMTGTDFDEVRQVMERWTEQNPGATRELASMTALPS